MSALRMAQWLFFANKEGLRSLSDHLKSLAEEPPGTHIHMDAYNSLEEGSLELILETI